MTNATEGERSATPRRRPERDAMALRLKAAGRTWQEIADTLGLRSISSAHDAVSRALARSTGNVDVEEYRLLELERLDDLWRALFPQAIGTPARRNAAGQQLAAIPPDLDAVDRLVRISMHRTRLLGMYREPMVNWETEIRRAAVAAGEDPDEAVREAQALMRTFEGKGRGGLKLVSAQ